ncbi:PREDICTED: E3 ubiquitin-protein ligase RDUF1-like [Tarenaya hassleriana]|uniref:E3 ubiquitin-protein ligase RDUF1-like n=1 Tax=Tarenaya hassleriana TaxID=28532 RepID=UPI00053C4669|nr:PREDICTED: E3 ubiquitin-protein ligase RDUF1-like [Tarenaya hassleriana]
MATEREAQRAETRTETPSVFQGVLRNRDHLFLFTPFLLGFSDSHTHRNPNPDPPGNNARDDPPPPERIVLVNPFTQVMVVIHRSPGSDPLLRTLVGNRKSGRPPASKASVDALPAVEIESGGGECAICLDDMVVGETGKEMPCKHRFHGQCIEKWLLLHGSCPVCRFEMPVDEDQASKKRDDDEGGQREIWVRFSFSDGGRRGRDSEHDALSDNGDQSVSGETNVVESEN